MAIAIKKRKKRPSATEFNHKTDLFEYVVFCIHLRGCKIQTKRNVPNILTRPIFDLRSCVHEELNAKYRRATTNNNRIRSGAQSDGFNNEQIYLLNGADRKKISEFVRLLLLTAHEQNNNTYTVFYSICIHFIPNLTVVAERETHVKRRLRRT